MLCGEQALLHSLGSDLAQDGGEGQNRAHNAFFVHQGIGRQMELLNHPVLGAICPGLSGSYDPAYFPDR